jgi:Fructose-bisphosphate aldolase class-I
MTSRDLESVAQTLVAEGKGILAADETIPTLTRRFDTLGIRSTEQSRRTYREMLFTSPGAASLRSCARRARSTKKAQRARLPFAHPDGGAGRGRPRMVYPTRSP